jgi:hypothetical protein
MGHLPLAVGSAAAIAAFNALPGVLCRLIVAVPGAYDAQAFADLVGKSFGRPVFEIDENGTGLIVAGGDEAQVPATGRFDDANIDSVSAADEKAVCGGHGCVPGAVIR